MKPFLGVLLAALVVTAAATPQVPTSGKETPLLAARACVNQGQFNDAIARYSEYLTDNPDDAEVLAEAGAAMLKADRVDEGVVTLAESLRRKPDQPRTIRLLADGCMARKDTAGATEIAQLGVMKYPEDVAMRLKLAEVDAKSGRKDDAIWQYRKVLATEPGNAPAMQALIDLGAMTTTTGAPETTLAPATTLPSTTTTTLAPATTLPPTTTTTLAPATTLPPTTTTTLAPATTLPSTTTTTLVPATTLPSTTTTTLAPATTLPSTTTTTLAPATTLPPTTTTTQPVTTTTQAVTITAKATTTTVQPTTTAKATTTTLPATTTLPGGSDMSTSDGYVTVLELAQTMSMDYRDLSEGAIRACKIHGGGHEVVVYADARSLIVNSVPVSMTRPARWNGRVIVVPDDAADLLFARFSVAYPSPAAMEAGPAADAAAAKARYENRTQEREVAEYRSRRTAVTAAQAKQAQYEKAVVDKEARDRAAREAAILTPEKSARAEAERRTIAAEVAAHGARTVKSATTTTTSGKR